MLFTKIVRIVNLQLQRQAWDINNFKLNLYHSWYSAISIVQSTII